MAKILFIEDEESIRTMLSYDLKQAGHEVDTYGDGKIGYEHALKNKYNIIILDLLLPGMDGRDIAKALKQKGIDSYIIMLSALDDEFDKLKGFEFGADDYMTKPFSPREINAKIKAILKRTTEKSDQNILSTDDIIVNLQTYSVTVKDKVIKLTQKELELLMYFMKNPKTVLNRDQLLNEVWGYEYYNDSRVVDVFIGKLRTKIKDSTHQIKTVRGIGYMFD